MMSAALDHVVLDALRQAIGDKHVFAGDNIEARYHSDLIGQRYALPLCVVRPGTTSEVARIMQVASTYGIPVTPQGGMTGTVEGAIANAGTIAMSLERMNQIEELDTISMTVTAGAGVPLQAVQEAAEAEGLFLPLDIGSRGSATVGGVIATNAGGLRAIRWGLARDMVLGVEAVLADGTVVTGLRKVLKDNAGYDWKHLLIGSEGTLGVVTRATLRLRPMPRSAMTALLAVPSFASVLGLLRNLEAELGGQLTSFELMWRDFYQLITETNRSKRTPPMSADHPFYVLVEAMGGDPEGDLARFESVLAATLERGDVNDAVIAQSERERADLWAVREDLGEPMMRHFPMFAFDVSVALRDMADFADEVVQTIRADYPGAIILVYGHAGDNNLHFVVGVGDGSKDAERKVDLAVYGCVAKVGGSISAEHGIGITKRDFLSFSRSKEEIALMGRLKRALDPQNILNPGKVIDLREQRL